MSFVEEECEPYCVEEEHEPCCAECRWSHYCYDVRDAVDCERYEYWYDME